MHISRFLFVLFVFGSFLFGCGDDSGGPGGTGGSDAQPFVPEAYGRWLKFEPDGAVCANGTQYKYFARFSETSDNVVVFFEPGGGCWDYETCASGDPFNTECLKDPGSTCLRDDYATAYTHFDLPDEVAEIAEQFGIIDGDVPVDFAFSILSPDSVVSPMADWNKVFLPYCTGDTHIGNAVRTYSDPTGQEPDVEFHHKGFENTQRVIDEMNRMFPEVPRMMVTGCSAGGVAAMANYSFIREGMPGIERGYVFADGAPIIPSKLENGEDSHSLQLQITVHDVWDLGPIIARIPGASQTSPDQGAVNQLVAQAYPEDRFSVLTFSRDYNFPLNGYDGFIEFFETNGPETPAGRTEVYRLWDEDLGGLRADFDTQPNLAYYLPYYRTTNNSHCLTIAGFEDFESLPAFAGSLLSDPATTMWKGTEIEAAGTTALSYLEHVLNDDEELQSYFETECEGRFQVCALDCATYDEDKCVDEVAKVD